VCSACFSRLPRPKPDSATAPGRKRPRAASDSDGDSDASNSDQDERATESKDSNEPPPLPHNSVAAGYEYGRLRHLPPLTLIETAILAKVIPYGTIVKLKEWRGISQRALTGQTICFPSDGPEAAASFEANRFKTQFPFHSNATLAEHVRVAFVGPANQAKDYINILMQPDGPLYFKAANVIQWLRVLSVTHPNYTDVVIPSEAELEATLAPLRQLIVDQAQVVDDETARFMESAKIGTDIAGVRSVCVDDDIVNAASSSDAAAGQPSSSQDAAAEPDAHLNAAGVPDRLPLVMSDVVIIDGTNRDEDPDQRLLDALNATMRKQPTDDSEAPAAEPDSLFCRRGDDPVNEFENSRELLTCAFPHAFPFGVGVPRSSLSPKFTRYLTHTSFIEQTQYRQAICSVEMASFTPCWAHARTLACGFCRCNYLLLFFPITTCALVSFVTLLRTPHPLATILLSVLSQTKRICLEVRVMASGWGPPQLRRVRRGSSCFKRVQSVSAGSSDSCCCRRCFAGR
jgi:hypothetical protein